MIIRGDMMREFLIVMILGTTTALFISLPISRTNDNTLVESIFGHIELHQERKEK